VAETGVVALMRLVSGRARHELELRMGTWWMILGLFYSAVWMGKPGLLLFWMAASVLAFREFTKSLSVQASDRAIVALMNLAAFVQYYLIYINWYNMMVIWIPLYVFLIAPLFVQLLGARPQGFLKVCGTLQYGLMYTVFALSHAAAFVLLPDCNPNGGNAGYIAYLAALTELNDVAQYVSGKSLAHYFPYKIAPNISPSKTWVGFVGGVVVTCLLAVLFAPMLTPFDTEAAALTGLVICVGGFIGGLGNSAMKRDIGVKDSGTLLPGHGGIIDRVDSLTYSAPLFFHLVRKYYVLAH